MKLTTEQYEEKILKNWSRSSAIYYLAQIFSDECTVAETIEDLVSLDEPTQARRE